MAFLLSMRSGASLQFSKFKVYRTRSIFKRQSSTEVLNNEDSKSKELSSSSLRKICKITCGKFANLANGCAVAEYEGTAVMATVVGKDITKTDEVSLSVHYQQKTAAIGRIPTNFLRRDLGQSDIEILTSRIIDRSVRPLFETEPTVETQIICSPLALDGKNFPDVLAINAASAALACSNVPWNGPVAAVRVGLINSEPILNPSKLELAESSLNLIVSVTKNNLITMLEGCGNNVSVNDFQKCIKVGMKNCRATLQLIEEVRKNYGKKKMDGGISSTLPASVTKLMTSIAVPKLKSIFSDFNHNKVSRDSCIKDTYSEIVEEVMLKHPETDSDKLSKYFYSLLKDTYASHVFETGIRCDGRELSELRKIKCENNLYGSLHGSALFQRGQTQVFCTVALDSPNSALRLDNISQLTSGVKEKNFFVHYEFPPFATGEIKRLSRPNRREIGHGMLAERALKASIPKSFPFTIRLTSEVLESNGSSSMATVCGGTLALFDAGIPLEFPVAGVAMGLITKKEHDKIVDYRILTDLMGMEDYLGDMDLKIAGTKNGITAIQFDVKVPGLPTSIIHEAIHEARKAFNEILTTMNSVINKPREDSKVNWPVVRVITIPPHKRANFIGLGGVNLKKLEIEVGIQITEMESGRYSIFAPNESAMDEALQRIEKNLTVTREPTLEFGGIYVATVVEVIDKGCLVSLYPNMTPALIPTSQLDVRTVHHPSALGMEVGKQFQVKYFGRDPVTGAMRLSKKALTFTEQPVAVDLSKK